MILDETEASALQFRQEIRGGRIVTKIDGKWRPLIRVTKAIIAEGNTFKRQGNRLLVTVANGDAEYRIISDCHITREVTAQLVRASTDHKAN